MFGLKLLNFSFLITAKSYKTCNYITQGGINLKTDPVHKKVMKTLCSYMEAEDMEYTEAVEAAVSKRKYLLNSLFDEEYIPRHIDWRRQLNTWGTEEKILRKFELLINSNIFK